MGRPSQASGQPAQVGVHRDPGQSEGLTEHDVGRLAADTWQVHQLFKRHWHFPVKAFTQLLTQALQACRLGTKEACGVDDPFQLGTIGTGEVGSCAKPGKQLRSHLVDPHVGALGAQNRRGQKLQRRAEVQFAPHVGILLLQSAENRTKSPLLCCQLHHPNSVCVRLTTSRVLGPRLMRQNEQVDEVVMGAPLFAALDIEGATALRASLVERTVVKGEVLFAEGEPGDRMYVIVDGKVKLGQTSVDGRESLLAVLGPGEMFGELSLFDPGQRTSTATALTDAVVLGLGNDQLRPWLAGRPEVATALLQALARRLRRTNEAMADLVFSDVPGRVAKALMDLGEKFGTITPEGLMVTHDMTQEELAQLVGASRETVNKALADFAQRGWIRLESRQVLILDVERLGRRAR